jgi:uncharacterized protein YkwD
MQITRITGGLLPIALLGLFLISPVTARAMTLPQLLEHDGLTIEQPLTVSPAAQDDITMSLTFGEQKEIAVTAPAAQEVLAEAIVVPTVEEELPEVQKKVISPTVWPADKTQKAISSTTSTLAQATNPTTTSIPTAVPQPQPKADRPLAETSTQQLQLSNGGLNADKLFSMTNSYRQSKGLPPVQKDDRVCQVASSRAPEIAAEIAGGHMHSGIRERNLPYWNSEIIITMRTEEEAFNWWINDTIHREAIEGNYTYSCTACHGNACVQEFTNFQAK